MNRRGSSEPQPRLIEDYALLSDLQTAALVHRRGSIDWCCFPRFDSDACFAALLGHREHGSWVVSPSDEGEPRRRYRDTSLVLETEWETHEGKIRLSTSCLRAGRRRRSPGSSRESRVALPFAPNS
jgi:GH15 family glucan-1,4-alpha-glucosidase